MFPVARPARTKPVNFKNALFSTVVILGLLGTSAYGYVGTPTLLTPNPVAGQPIQLAIPIGDCDGYFMTDDPPPFVRNGQTIRVDATTREFGTCIFPRVTWTFPVGSYEQGTYEIQLYETHVFLISVTPPVTRLIETFTVNVAAGTPASTPVPAGGPVSWGVLTALLLMVASFHRRIAGSRVAKSATTRRATRR